MPLSTIICECACVRACVRACARAYNVPSLVRLVTVIMSLLIVNILNLHMQRFIGYTTKLLHVKLEAMMRHLVDEVATHILPWLVVKIRF